jgi:hypothetical protein
VREVATSEQGNLERLEVARHHRRSIDVRRLGTGSKRLAFTGHWRLEASHRRFCIGHWRREIASHRPNAGDRGDAGCQLIEECLTRTGSVERRARRVYVGHQETLWMEAKIDVLQANQASHQQTGAREQGERHRDFGDDERRAHAGLYAIRRSTSG